MKRKENMGFLKTTRNHIRRSPYQAFAAILIIMQTFFVISVFTLLVVGSSKAISYFESVPQINAFFKDEAKQQDITALENQLQAAGKIAQMHFVSKQEALKIYKQQNKDDDPLLLELVTADVLPTSLQVSTNNINDLSSVSDILKSSTLVDKVVFQKDVVSRLTSWTNAIRKIGIAFVVVLALDSILIMVIIIGIKISQKKDEIEIVRLIGATKWYIRWPFLYEGIFYGLVGAFIGWLFCVGALWYAMPFLSSFLKGIPILPVSWVFLLELLGAEFILAIFLGALSSYLAVLRYLK